MEEQRTEPKTDGATTPLAKQEPQGAQATVQPAEAIQALMGFVQPLIEFAGHALSTGMEADARAKEVEAREETERLRMKMALYKRALYVSAGLGGGVLGLAFSALFLHEVGLVEKILTGVLGIAGGLGLKSILDRMKT